MNKDVIYIEPEQDITDILANIKSSKHRIIALVPPKKAGVLRSAVNFKLIAKTARQNDKTVVLITADESLRRLASSVAMPTAKTLQSKPRLPDEDDAAEFGEKDDSDTIEDDKAAAEDEAEEEVEEAKPVKKVPVATAVKVTKKKAAADEEVIEGEPEPEEDDTDKPKSKNQKNTAKMKGTKIPNIAKYRKFIIAGAIGLVLIIGFSIWANVFAPFVNIDVTVRTTTENFTEKVTFVTDESKSDAKKGILFLEQKSVTKKAEADFQATGQVDKGAKASGTVTVTRPKGEIIANHDEMKFSIPKGTTFTISGKAFVSTEQKDIVVDDKKMTLCDLKACTLEASSAAVPVVAKENGEGYNIAAVTSGITSSITIPKSYTISSSAMTGGSSKIIKVVSKEDVEKASSGLDVSGESEAREELASQFSNDYILLGNMTKSEPKITTSPNLNEEVGDNVTPKIVREVTYTLYAVPRDAVKTYINEVVSSRLGDDTQQVYDTGIDKAFFESFQNSNDSSTAKLKSTVKTGPRVTKEMVAERALGKKIGEVKTTLESINGVSSVKPTPSFFWVSRVPDDINKVNIEIKVE